jgi:hypothetical protein
MEKFCLLKMVLLLSLKSKVRWLLSIGKGRQDIFEPGMITDIVQI